MADSLIHLHYARWHYQVPLYFYPCKKLQYRSTKFKPKDFKFQRRKFIPFKKASNCADSFNNEAISRMNKKEKLRIEIDKTIQMVMS